MRVDKEILFCFGSFLSPSFEKVPYDPATPKVTLARSISGASSTPPSKAASQMAVGDKVQPTVSVGDKVKVLGPGTLSAMTTTKQREEEGTASASRKRKLSERKDAAASFEEILAASSSSSSLPSKTRPSTSSPPAPQSSQLGLLPKPKEKTILLTQGLVSQDAAIINSVLQESNDLVIRNTVQSLSIDYVQSLLDVVAPRLTGHSKTATNAAKWLKWVLKSHAGFLLTHGHLLDRMEKMRRSMEARAETLERASKLQGRIELVLAQARLRKERREAGGGEGGGDRVTTATVGGSNPLFTYEEDSDDGEGGGDDNDLMRSMKDSDSEDEDAAMGEWIDISAPASPVAATVRQRKDGGIDDDDDDDDDDSAN